MPPLFLRLFSDCNMRQGQVKVGDAWVCSLSMSTLTPAAPLLPHAGSANTSILRGNKPRAVMGRDRSFSGAAPGSFATLEDKQQMATRAGNASLNLNS